MTEASIQSIINNSGKFFRSGATLDISYRIDALKRMRKFITENERFICDALKDDLGKSAYEAYMCEIGLCLSEITYMLKHLKGFSRTKRVRTPMSQFPGKSYVIPSPYGVVLIMSPWNYPFLLTIEPLIDALSAGNVCVLKPSAYSPATTEIIKKMISECFPEEYVSVITGGRSENTCLLNQHFDYIFFTGSKQVGREVMKNASLHLTPVTLELGGKSPCIVLNDADLKSAARRIVFGKYLNCGQTCVAPDYILCHSSVRDELLKLIKSEIAAQFGNYISNDDYGRIINEKHFSRLAGLIDDSRGKIFCGGNYDSRLLKIEPTVITNITDSDSVMQDEIFGPVLPVMTFDEISEVISYVNKREHPLALYVFTENTKLANQIIASCGFGGGCINDTIVHLATTEMGFGGFGESGMGSYHGRAGFDTFTHYKSIIKKGPYMDLSIRYQPYRKNNLMLVKRFLR